MMKPNKILLSVVTLLATQLLMAQQTEGPWSTWNHLTGEWVGEGNGKPGQGEGKFSFHTSLDGKIMIRNNHTVFPATTNQAERVHDDLLIIYQQKGTDQQEAIYFDNEGNTIKYNVGYSGDSVILTSDISDNSPRFRLSYIKIDSNTVNITFEIAPPKAPEEFKIYLSGKAFKVK